MAYVAPNSIIKILKNIPLEADYVNTLYFDTVSAQTTYFSGKAKYTLTAQSYQRANKGVCRVNYKVEDLYDCNYLMFQNTSFGTKWFYAFITKVDYVNNVTADIHYQIDVMQTWLKDMSLRMCFVEREHSGSDEIGDNIMPEPIETGELVFNTYHEFNDLGVNHLNLKDLCIAVMTVNVSQPSGKVVDGIYSGAFITCFAMSSTGVQHLNDFIEGYEQQPDAILGMYMLPIAALGDASGLENVGGVGLPYHVIAEDYDVDDTALADTMTIDGHVVRNKKLFTYPYNFYHIDNGNGRELALRYEFFKNSSGVRNYKPQFKLFVNVCQPVTAVLRPMNYKGVPNGDFVKTESIDITGYPMCSWNVDSWKAWVAQNSVPEAISAYTSVFSGVSSGISGLIGIRQGVGAHGGDEVFKEAQMAAGGASTGVEIVGGILTRAYKASIKADVCKGSLNNGNINVASHLQNFFGGRMSVCNQMAKVIDDFFDKYGYATNEVKVPNIRSRTSWNYVKTVGSNVDGNIPAIDKSIIDANFDRGITFWHDPAHVDDYSQNNAPVSP